MFLCYLVTLDMSGPKNSHPPKIIRRCQVYQGNDRTQFCIIYRYDMPRVTQRRERCQDNSQAKTIANSETKTRAKKRKSLAKTIAILARLKARMATQSLLLHVHVMYITCINDLKVTCTCNLHAMYIYGTWIVFLCYLVTLDMSGPKNSHPPKIIRRCQVYQGNNRTQLWQGRRQDTTSYFGHPRSLRKHERVVGG